VTVDPSPGWLAACVSPRAGQTALADPGSQLNTRPGKAQAIYHTEPGEAKTDEAEGGSRPFQLTQLLLPLGGKQPEVRKNQAVADATWRRVRRDFMNGHLDRETALQAFPGQGQPSPR
jgi:hypothetical protein